MFKYWVHLTAMNRFETMNVHVRLFLFWTTLSLQVPEGSAVTVSRESQDANFDMSLEKKWSTLQIKPEITVSVIVGNATELPCRNKTSEGFVMWWQTPFGSFGGRYEFSNKNPIQMIMGNLRISTVTLSHTGHYSCHLKDRKGITVIPYIVNVLSWNTHKTKPKMRTAREAVTSTIHYSDTDFVVAVSSSVLVTFIGAFILGAFSQPYVIKCLQRSRTWICPNKRNLRDTPDSKLRTVCFRRNSNSEEGTVDFVPFELSVSLETSNINSDQDGSHLVGNSNTINTTTNKSASDELDQAKDSEREKQNAGLESETITRTQLKRVSRVIKLYNYDEDGNRYSHIKEPEGNPTPRQRVMSLTRLQSIMNDVETQDFSSSRDTSEPDEALGMT